MVSTPPPSSSTPGPSLLLARGPLHLPPSRLPPPTVPAHPASTVPAHPPLTRTPASHQKPPQGTPPRARHSSLGVRFSDELEVQFFETGDGDGSSRVVRRQIVDLAGASDVCSSAVGSGSECTSGHGGSEGSGAGSCGLSCQNHTDRDGIPRDISASAVCTGVNGLKTCVAGDCEEPTEPDSEADKGCGSSETPKSSGLSRGDGARDCKPSSGGRQCDEDDETDCNRADDNTSNNHNEYSHSNGSKNHRGNSHDEDDADDDTRPTRILNLQVLGPRVTQHLKLHCMRPAFTLEGRRACTGEFRGDFGCTVGVDYRVLEVIVGGVRAVLQLWDTAGQERFRSITRQYYRKADGVVVMYDVTNEQSFLSVNDWLTSVKETAGADVSVAVLGNKCDLAAARRVPKDTAYKMIRGHNCLMYEVSAASGNGVQESIKHLAALLATQQEHDLATSTALELHSEDKKKKFCCRE
ncbi:putative EF-hand calcium-binding domain-containing protein 4B [Penaeus vannamei]|uniref:Putative EF-hand calcium-binding domain-containing protein 4B n=1 Tax=Penaeus vannamei TaxID=6689 RepID=A0A3R7PDS3_PENVA|nr:putative EF-hand calcium-binding domain-containing protein 4B [Penaeus vannamei]